MVHPRGLCFDTAKLCSGGLCAGVLSTVFGSEPYGSCGTEGDSLVLSTMLAPVHAGFDGTLSEHRSVIMWSEEQVLESSFEWTFIDRAYRALYPTEGEPTDG